MKQQEYFSHENFDQFEIMNLCSGDGCGKKKKCCKKYKKKAVHCKKCPKV